MTTHVAPTCGRQGTCGLIKLRLNACRSLLISGDSRRGGELELSTAAPTVIHITAILCHLADTRDAVLATGGVSINTKTTYCGAVTRLRRLSIEPLLARVIYDSQLPCSPSTPLAC